MLFFYLFDLCWLHEKWTAWAGPYTGFYKYWGPCYSYPAIGVREYELGSIDAQYIGRHRHDSDHISFVLYKAFL